MCQEMRHYYWYNARGEIDKPQFDGHFTYHTTLGGESLLLLVPTLILTQMFDQLQQIKSKKMLKLFLYRVFFLFLAHFVTFVREKFQSYSYQIYGLFLLKSCAFIVILPDQINSIRNAEILASKIGLILWIQQKYYGGLSYKTTKSLNFSVHSERTKSDEFMSKPILETKM